MKLNTKKVFEGSSSLKSTPKLKKREPNKNRKNSIFISRTNTNKTSKNKANSNLNIKQKLFIDSNKKANPFSEPPEKKSELKKNKLSKLHNNKLSKFKLELEKNENDLFDEHFVNKIKSINETDINNNNFEQNRKIEKQLSLNDKYNVFKNTVLKSAFIVDENGNNNLDFEQKEIIDNYFNKKTYINKKGVKKYERSRIKKIPTQIYIDNKILFRKISNKMNHLKNTTTDTNDNTNNNNKKYGNTTLDINYNKLKSGCIRVEENLFKDKIAKIPNCRKMRSTQFNSYFLIDDEKSVIEKRNKKQINEYENNSLFENDSNSFDSSFLGSSFDEDFYKNINKN